MITMCPLCGNCTDSKNCDVCGMKLCNDGPAEDETISYEAAKKSFRDKTEIPQLLFHIDIKSP